ncbi:ligand-binding sensor domain-containing protein, partial [Bacteroides heparinolyticus]
MKTLLRYIYVWLAMIAMSMPCHFSKAQTGKFYSTENGLSSSLINQLFQDSKGFIWVATEYGLNRFDGLNFFTYRHVPDDAASLTSDYVRTIFEDSRHNLLIGCINGLMRYDRETDTFCTIPMIRAGKKVTPHVTHFQEVNQGEIWLSTSGQGLFRLDDRLTKAVSVDSMFQQVNCTYQSKFCIDSRSDIWIGTDGNGLVRYVSGTKTLQYFKYPTFGDNNVTSILEDRSGNIFVGTQKQGVSRYDEVKGQMVPVHYEGDDKSVSVYCMAMVNGQIWVGTDGQGVKVYNPRKNRLEDYKINSAPVDFSKGKVHSIMQDRDGNLWIGLFQKGIVLVRRQENPFEYYGSKSIYYNPIGQGCVMSVFADGDGHLWAGADNEGLYELGVDGRRLRHFAPDGGAYSVPNTIICMYEDSDHNLWVGSYGQGVEKLNKTTGRSEPFSQIDGSVVYTITEDKEKNLYFAVFGSGFYRYNLLSGKMEHYVSSKDEKGDLKRNELANDWINYIFCDSEGLLWLGHYKGVSCFNPKTKNFVNYRQTNTLITGCIGYAFAEDGDGNIWVGTTNGLYCFNKKTSELKQYTTADGLPNNVICGICED